MKPAPAETFDQYSSRRWHEMHAAHRAGRPYPESGMSTKKNVAKIRAEYNKRLH